jgi:hypothetical protein
VNHPWGGGLVIGKSGPHYHNHSRFQQITFKLKQTFAVGGTKNVLLFSKQITFQSFIIKKTLPVMEICGCKNLDSGDFCGGSNVCSESLKKIKPN